jgi:hypothetical protein
MAALLLEPVAGGEDGLPMPARFWGGGVGPVTPWALSGSFSPKSGSVDAVLVVLVD